MSNKVFNFGTPDKRDLWHLIIGAVGFYFAYFSVLWIGKLGFDWSLDAKWVALIAIFCGAFIWEYRQRWINKEVMIDVKDILVSCAVGIVSCFFL